MKSLTFRETSSGADLLVLASGSQDSTIRLWNIEPLQKEPANSVHGNVSNPPSDALLDAFEASLGELTDVEEGGRQISLKRHVLSVKSTEGRFVM